MTLQGKFSASEWETLQFAPLWVHTTVGMVDGKIDVNETDALADEIRKAIFWKNDLAREVLSSIADNFNGIIQKYIDDPRGVREGLTQVNELLARKVDPEDALGFKKALLTLAERTARASGGWQGSKWTGSSTSEEESKAIHFIYEVFNISEDDLNQ